MDLGNLCDRHVPLAIVAALLMQAGTAVWWAAGKNEEVQYQEQRITVLETAMGQADDRQTRVLERLARIEERVDEEAGTLGRIEKQLGAARP
ncbi:MAG TPA: hypothetical protein VMV79_03020 [Alphaproteobacteria bacterium]|nr:hypothetical protein [Alphaproteobacteria bacterium]